jgi:hypothetical protein
MIRMEGLDEHLDQAAAAESETEEDVGGRRVVVREDSGASVGEPRPNTFREIALHAAAADQAKSLAIFTDDGPRAGAAVRRPVCADDRDEHAALAGAGQRSHRGDDSVDLVHDINDYGHAAPFAAHICIFCTNSSEVSGGVPRPSCTATIQVRNGSLSITQPAM